jgi:tetratricopeptide (TPR) repeat protein
MSSSESISKPPPERTLVAAIIFLGVVALVQLVAVGYAVLPRLDYNKLSRVFSSRPATAAVPANSPSEVEAQTELVRKANALLDEGVKFRESQPPNFQGALETVIEADRLVPNKPGMLLQMASDYAMLNRKPEAVATLQKIVALPPSSDPLDAGYIAQARAALNQLGAAPAPEAGAPLAKPGAATSPSAHMRDDVGIPPGSVMGIVSAQFVDAEPGTKNLRVAMKGASGQTIDPTKVQATVDFYEQDDNAQIIHNESQHPSEWLSAPVDWAEASPEIFQVKYRMPLKDRGDLAPLQYYGYVVAIYYDGELQDQRPDPPSLLDQHAPPLHKDAPPPAE